MNAEHSAWHFMEEKKIHVTSFFPKEFINCAWEIGNIRTKQFLNLIKYIKM